MADKTFTPDQTHWLFYRLDGLTRRVKLIRGIEYSVLEEGYPFYELRREIRQDVLCEATEAARMLASARGVPLNLVSGNGDEGRILKSDVQTFIDKREG